MAMVRTLCSWLSALLRQCSVRACSRSKGGDAKLKQKESALLVELEKKNINVYHSIYVYHRPTPHRL